jgi:acetyl-CoA carboxylase biotin carboxyl carrier protein
VIALPVARDPAWVELERGPAANSFLSVIQVGFMSNAGPESDDIFDLQRLRRLVDLMNEHGLGEVDLRDGDVRVRLRKEGAMLTAMPAFAAQMPMAAAPARGSGEPTAPAAPVDSDVVIKSPMVGTFFLASSPESAPYVKVGDHVGPTTTVCIIEAMKVFNEIPAEVSGKITAVLVQNGEAVEYGRALFKVGKA